MKPKILVIEDSKDYQLIFETALRPAYDIYIATTGSEAMQKIERDKFNLFIVDITLPDMDGLQICNFIKCQDSTKNIPVIMVTGKNSIDDLVKGFDRGADDYIFKPFHFEELLSRVKAKLRQEQQGEEKGIHIPGLEIDVKKQHIRTKDGTQNIDLTRIEFKLLVYFAQRVDHVLSRQQILDFVWPENLNISERTVDSHISNLRRKIAGLNIELNAVHGSGYRFSVRSNTAAA